MAGNGTDKVLLWDWDLWLDGIYPTPVLLKCSTALGSCRTALRAQGTERVQA